MVQPITPNFNGNITDKVYNGVKRTIADPTDVQNKDAAVGGAVAASGIGGAAVVASKLKTMKNVAVSSSKFATSVKMLNNKNLSSLSKFATTVGAALKKSKLTSWISRLIEMPPVKKFGAGFGGMLALGITVAQLYSAGDMAFEAIDTYTNKK